MIAPFEHFRGRALLSGLHWGHALVPLLIVFCAAAYVAAMVGGYAFVAVMGPAVVAGLLIVMAALPLGLVAVWQHQRTGWLALAVLAGLFLLNMVSVSLPRVYPFDGLVWNWQGKTLDLLWSLALLALLTPAMRREIGWTLKINPGSLAPAFINIAILMVIGFVVIGGEAQGDMGRRALTFEQLLFDTTYPNLTEELVFRGFMLAMLDRAFPPRWTFGGAKIGWGVVLTAWLFGLAHGITPGADGGIVFEPPWLGMTLMAGLVFGWIRALTGSLWPAFLAHCAPELGMLLALALR